MRVLQALRIVYARMLCDHIKKWEDRVEEGTKLETKLNALNVYPYGTPSLAKHTYPGAHCFINTEYITWQCKRYKFGSRGISLYALLFVYSALNTGMMKYNEILKNAVRILRHSCQSYNYFVIDNVTFGLGVPPMVTG